MTATNYVTVDLSVLSDEQRTAIAHAARHHEATFARMLSSFVHPVEWSEKEMAVAMTICARVACRYDEEGEEVGKGTVQFLPVHTVGKA